MMRLEGVLTKAIAGFYYVEAGSGVFTCKAKGAFRKNGDRPLVGDRIVRENCTGEYNGANPQDDVMERLLRARKGNG